MSIYFSFPHPPKRQLPPLAIVVVVATGRKSNPAGYSQIHSPSVYNAPIHATKQQDHPKPPNILKKTTPIRKSSPSTRPTPSDLHVHGCHSLDHTQPRSQSHAVIARSPQTSDAVLKEGEIMVVKRQGNMHNIKQACKRRILTIFLQHCSSC